ncbi:MAG: hypothetical protein ACTSYR_04980 [Candidatus Odinarchaeia archaeon]
MSKKESRDINMKNELSKIAEKKPVNREDELLYSGINIGFTYALSLWLDKPISHAVFHPLKDESMINFSKGYFSSENLESRFDDIIYWKDDKIEVLKELSPRNWGVYWAGVTGGVDRIDTILFSEVYLEQKPFIHFELNPIKIQDNYILKEYYPETSSWKKTDNNIRGYIRRFLTFYRTGFLTLNYFLILTSKKREWLKSIHHATSDKPLSTGEVIYLLNRKLNNLKISDFKTSLDRIMSGDFKSILCRFYGVPDFESDTLIQNLIDKTYANYYSISIWDINCNCVNSHKNALDIIYSHPWEFYGLKGPDRNWRNRSTDYIKNIVEGWFSPYSDIAYKPTPRVHLEISYPLTRRKKLVAMGDTSPPIRIWEFRVLLEKIFRTFNYIISRENLTLSRTSNVEELIKVVQKIINFRRVVITILEDNYWISNNIRHLPDRNYFDSVRYISGIKDMKSNLIEKLNSLAEISKDLANIMDIQVGSRMSQIRTYASVISVFLATILAIASSITSFFIWSLGPPPEALGLIDKIIVLLELLGLNAGFLAPIILILWKILRRYR